MELHNGYNDDVRGNSTGGVIVSNHDKYIDICIRFYRRKFHFIVIPFSIIFGIIHLRFAVEYLGQCTIQPMINIYMIVHASIVFFVALLALIGIIDVRCIYSGSEENNNKIVGRRIILIIIILTLILFLFSFIWLLLGSVWIFSAKTNGVQGLDHTMRTTYCQSDFYRAAFTLIIVNYVVHSLIILLIILRRMCCQRGHIVSNDVVAMEKA